MCDLVNQQPTSYEEDAQKKEWVEEMMKEYQSIMKNDVWDIVPKPKSKSVVSSKWIYKIKHVVDGILKSTKQDLWLEDYLRKRGSIMRIHFLQ